MDPREPGGGRGGMERPFRRSRLRFASAMSSIMEKYNFPFDNDLIVSIKSLTFETPNGPMVWGEETSDEITNDSYQNTVQCQENTESHELNLSVAESADDDDDDDNNNTVNSNEELPVFNEEIQQCQVSDFENEDYEEYQSSEEEQFTNSYGENQLEFSDHHSVVLRKEAQSSNGYSAPKSLRLYNAAVQVLAPLTTGSGNQSLWSNNETAHSSFLEMYESANEQCSWNNVTIADLYPGMVRALSRLMTKASHRASSGSLIKRYRHGHWQPKLGCLNISTERIRKFRPLKMKTSLTVTKDHRKRGKLPMVCNGSNSPLDDGNSQMQCSVDRMEVDPSDTVEDGSYIERIGAEAAETIIFPNNISTEETFLVKSSSCIPSSSNCVRKGQSSEKNSSAVWMGDSKLTLLPAVEDKSGEMNTLSVKAASCLKLSLNSSTSSYLQNTKSSPVTTSNGLLGNHEIKIFSTTIALQRSHSLSSLSFTRSPIKASQKCDDAFEKMYKELCSPKVQKPLALPNTYTSPRKSVLKNHSSTLHLKSNEMFDNIYQKIRSGKFPKIPTFLRAANLKKYEGIQMSETVNALVNSPIRTLPAVARIKRAANFCNEDVQTSPIKRLKNVSENSSRECQKPPY
ncbi:Holliday junction recognition protein, partial [Tiliqua scincoides]|uniref:Holliday junction recognition protein n=1 Tax=Tiliqua scincoides TaxID=71010 RepID=UPI00346357A6